MKTFLYIFSSAILVGFAFWAYRVNYDTQEAVSRVETLRAQIATEREAISVLRAEWAYLNRPDRLRALAETYFTDLQLMPMTADRFGEMAEVPMPPEDLDALVAGIVALSQDTGRLDFEVLE